MEQFFIVLNQIGIFLLLILLGVAAVRFGILDGQSLGSVSKLVMRMALPAFIFINTAEGAFYQLCGHTEQDHRDCFLLRCSRCGRIRHLDCSHLQALYDHLEKDHHFRIDPRGTLFTGVCDLCAGEEDAHGST